MKKLVSFYFLLLVFSFGFASSVYASSKDQPQEPIKPIEFRGSITRVLDVFERIKKSFPKDREVTREELEKIISDAVNDGKLRPPVEPKVLFTVKVTRAVDDIYDPPIPPKAN